MKLIDKDRVAAEIEERIHKYEQEYEELARYEIWGTAREIRPKIEELKNFRSFLDTIEVKEATYDEALERARKEYKNYKAFNSFRGMLVRIFPELRDNENEDDLEKEIIRVSKNEYFDFTDWKSIARHFYELGLKTKGE